MLATLVSDGDAIEGDGVADGLKVGAGDSLTSTEGCGCGVVAIAGVADGSGEALVSSLGSAAKDFCNESPSELLAQLPSGKSRHAANRNEVFEYLKGNTVCQQASGQGCSFYISVDCSRWDVGGLGAGGQG